MKFTSVLTILVLASLSCISPARAEPQPPVVSETVTSQAPTKAEILSACVRNRAETLPNPYTDVEPTHWAYKAVLSMYYCGAFRQATPPALIEQLLQSGRVPVQETQVSDEL